jgi:hypothetical protein
MNNTGTDQLKEQIRKLPRYSTNALAVLYPDERGYLVEIGAVLALVSNKKSDTIAFIPGIAEQKCNCPGDYYGWNGNADNHNDWCPMSRNYVGRTVDNKPGIAEEIRKSEIFFGHFNKGGEVNSVGMKLIDQLRSLLEENQQWKDEALLQARLYTEKNEQLQQLREELEQVKKERDSLPTQWAYDQACKALWKHRADAESLRSEQAA